MTHTPLGGIYNLFCVYTAYTGLGDLDLTREIKPHPRVESWSSQPLGLSKSEFTVCQKGIPSVGNLLREWTQALETSGPQTQNDVRDLVDTFLSNYLANTFYHIGSFSV